MIPAMNELPLHLYHAVQVRRLDRVATDELRIPGLTLMERAGAACFAQLRARWPQARRVCVLCGTGNNGGDGYVVARLAHEAGLQVNVMQVGAREHIAGYAAAALEKLTKAGVPLGAVAAATMPLADVIVDALLGTGTKGDATGEWRQAIDAINGAGRPVLAVDIPSGLHADTGRVLGTAVRAKVTVTFLGLKQGLFTGAGPDYTGEVVFDDLGVPPEVYRGVPPSAARLSDALLRTLLKPRARGAHKGDFGHTLVIGGDYGMSGAARLAAEGAARAGAGLVSVATRADHAALLGATRPEIMCHPAERGAYLRPLLANANVVAIGPGLGQSNWGREMLAAALESNLPLVIDADALNLIAQEPARREQWVLTPHPGEAARLLGTHAAEVQLDRFAAVRELQQRYGGVVVLKGAGTLVGCGDLSVAVCSAGNPGMASGGVGDVLTGVIAGLVAQGLSLKDAAYAGVHAHAAAADRASARGERGMLAGDVLAELRAVVNPLPE
jgi:NAD(P)H-hydrate epimerase